MILFAMVSATHPFVNLPGETSNTPMLHRIVRGEYNLPEGLSFDCGDLIQGLLTVDPKQRFTLHQVMEHPWMNEDVIPSHHLGVN